MSLTLEERREFAGWYKKLMDTRHNEIGVASGWGADVETFTALCEDMSVPLVILQRRVRNRLGVIGYREIPPKYTNPEE